MLDKLKIIFCFQNLIINIYILNIAYIEFFKLLVKQLNKNPLMQAPLVFSEAFVSFLNLQSSLFLINNFFVCVTW